MPSQAASAARQELRQVKFQITQVPACTPEPATEYVQSSFAAAKDKDGFSPIVTPSLGNFSTYINNPYEIKKWDHAPIYKSLTKPSN